MAITLTVQSLQPSGIFIIVTAIRSDNGQSVLINVDVSSAVSVLAAQTLVTNAISARSAIINNSITTATGLANLIGQSF